jgi:hypothetical protein
MVVYVTVIARRKFSIKKFNDKLSELGGKATFTNDGFTTRGNRQKLLWHHNRYQGGIEMGEISENRLFDVSVKGVDEDMLVGSFVAWLTRHFCKKINSIEIFPETARSGWEEP